ncbi:MAG: hypothetical protein J6B34_03895 [Clostridia bacterium]|nr:hypothetical protein [Clostridia bacterium]
MYQITTKTVLIDGKDVIIYGIKNDYDEISNISTRLDFVEKLVFTLNAKNVSPTHFRYVVEDLIASN